MSSVRHHYNIHPATVMTQEWILSLSERTGKSLEEWLIITQHSGLTTSKALTAWLKDEFGLGTNQAMWIANIALNTEESIAMSTNEGYLKLAEQWIDGQYGGKKQHLRPVYDHVLTVALEMGTDIRACPTKTYLSLFRQYAFAQIKPTTNSRIDLGLALGAEELPNGKLVNTGGAQKGDRITHRIPLTTVADVDDEVVYWLQKSYQRDEKNSLQ
jgi:hypothetical protein